MLVVSLDPVLAHFRVFQHEHNVDDRPDMVVVAGATGLFEKIIIASREMRCPAPVGPYLALFQHNIL